MALLVDYSSSESDAAASDTEPEAKKFKLQAPSPSTATTGQDKPKKTTGATNTTNSSPYPPLPSTFHDLYASTVRVSTRDDPTLHQGRKRQNPHVAGHWPSHLYTEWHPTTTGTSPEYETLTGLLDELSSSASAVAPDLDLKTFLTSDLGAPLPLHISLSRPLSLTTGNKDDFLDAVRAALARGPEIPAFSLRPTGLEWHRTAESARSFLVLRVESVTTPTTTTREADAEEGAAKRKNRELTQLLRRCNGVVQSFGQPALYAFAGGGDDGSKSTMDVGDAFHISVAWSFEPPTPELVNITRQVFESGKTSSYRDAMQGMHIRVDGVKAKIGNAVTHIALPEAGTKGLLGL
ncbi:U6 snRNA phosphodiesterase Usb1 [Apiospora aurea]|uniref:U6 snRNA phosphodiesterase n=1 Tax=Apiospora aurea TaxID=335848 RepID=A0ABR1QQX6_9PEZI